MKKEILAIEVADFPIHFSFGGVEQDEFLVQSEKIGALPHFARVHKVLGLLAIPFSTGERVQVVPFAKINRPIQQDSAALAALSIPSAHCRNHALKFTWANCAKQFVDQLSPAH